MATPSVRRRRSPSPACQGRGLCDEPAIRLPQKSRPDGCGTSRGAEGTESAATATKGASLGSRCRSQQACSHQHLRPAAGFLPRPTIHVPNLRRTRDLEGGRPEVVLRRGQRPHRCESRGMPALPESRRGSRCPPAEIGSELWPSGLRCADSVRQRAGTVSGPPGHSARLLPPMLLPMATSTRVVADVYKREVEQ